MKNARYRENRRNVDHAGFDGWSCTEGREHETTWTTHVIKVITYKQLLSTVKARTYRMYKKSGFFKVFHNDRCWKY